MEEIDIIICQKNKNYYKKNIKKIIARQIKSYDFW